MGWNDDQDMGPWGKKQKPRRVGGESQGPDIEDLLKKGRDRFNRFFGGGSGGNGKDSKNFQGSSSLIGLIFVIGIGLWAATGFYRVQEGEKAVIMRFGKAVYTTDPGLRYHLPTPIERALVVKVSEINVVRSGKETLAPNRKTTEVRGENVQDLMLTGDENIIKLRFTVQWFVKDIEQYLFNDPRPDETVKLAAESAVREVIAQTALAEALTKGKDKIIIDSKRLLQKILDDYHLGIEIVKVNLEEVNPPDSVIKAFRDVQAARADRERLINLAKAHRNSIIPVARGQAQKIIKAAEADKEAMIAIAKGESARFMSVLKAYLVAPEVTLTRLKIQNTEEVLKGMPKYLVSGDRSTQGVLPYLPLNAIKKETETDKTETDADKKGEK
jgi:membrane protease subunit HflK